MVNEEKKTSTPAVDPAPEAHGLQDGTFGPLPASCLQRVVVKVPPFWAEQPEIWFAQVESQFSNAAIRSDLSKYNTIVAAIDSQVLSQVSDAILNPPLEEKYANLKKCIIDRFCDSEQKKIQKLLSEVDLGDKRPTQLFQQLRGLAKDKVSDDFLKSLWLQRLPTHVQAILQASNAELSELAKLADKVMEVGGYGHVAAATTSASSSLAEAVTQLNLKVDRMEKMMASLMKNGDQRSRSKTRRSSSRSTTTPAAATNNDVCWYHQVHGNNATKCRSPCKFFSKN